MKIALLGDIAPFGRYCMAENPELPKQFKVVSEFLASHDLVIGNLETPFVQDDCASGWKSAHIKADPVNIGVLKSLGLTHVTLANNHIGDFGPRAYDRTKKLLENAGIGWFGTEGRQVHIERSGEKVALLGYCSYNTNPSRVRSGSNQLLNLLDIDDVIRDMSANVERGYLNILSVHSGQEHVHMPSYEDVIFARGLAERFDYIYYGHHPHVVQGAEQVCNSPIFYSVGNFIFDDVYTPRDHVKPLITLTEANKSGVIASVDIVGGVVQDWALTPTYLGHERIFLGDEIDNFDMQPYNDFLSEAGSLEYHLLRKNMITEYIDSRRSQRDFKWYIQRLNLNSLGLIISAKLNAKKYHSDFVAKLDRFEVKK